MTRVIVVAVLAALVATALWWFLLYSPANQQLQALQDETVQLETTASQLRGQIALLQDIGDRQLEIEADLGRLEQLIPLGAAQPALVREFQLIADSSGVVISTLDFSDPVPVFGAPPTGEEGLTLGAIEVTMTFEGGYFQAVDFFRRIEVDSPRAVLVDTLTLTQSEGGFPVLAVTWTGDLFARIVAPVDPNAVPAPTASGEPTPGATPTAGATAAPAAGAGAS